MNTIEKKIPTNISPFTNKYVIQEAEFYGLYGHKKGTVEVKPKTPKGRLDDYLNVNFVIDHPPVPALYINDELWMSLTRAELQGQWVAIKMARGRVGVGGCGLGYVILRMMGKPEVKLIDVYEINEDIIRFFKDSFKDRIGFNKVNFIHGDIQTNLVNKKYDLFFNDIYKTLLPDEALDDIQQFNNTNQIKEYRFWGEELAIAICLNVGEKVRLNNAERKFFRYWIFTDLYEGANQTGAEMRLVSEDLEFAMDGLNRLGKLGSKFKKK